MRRGSADTTQNGRALSNQPVDYDPFAIHRAEIECEGEVLKPFRAIEKDKATIQRKGEILREQSIQIPDVGGCVGCLLCFRGAAGFRFCAINMFQFRHCFDRQRCLYLPEQ